MIDFAAKVHIIYIVAKFFSLLITFEAKILVNILHHFPHNGEAEDCRDVNQ